MFLQGFQGGFLASADLFDGHLQETVAVTPQKSRASFKLSLQFQGFKDGKKILVLASALEKRAIFPKSDYLSLHRPL